MEQKYLIGQERLIELLNSEAELESLKAGGVDNWEGWDECSCEEIEEVPEEFEKA